MTIQQVIVLVLQVSVLLTVFGFGLQATWRDIQYLIRRPGLFARSLVSMFVVMPVVAVILVRVFELRPSLEIAIVTLAISPVPPLLPGKESKAGGHAAYGIGLMAIMSLLAIVVVPLSLVILGRYFDRDLQMPPAAIAKVVFTMTLLPLAAGMLARQFVPAAAARMARPIKLVSTVLLVVGAVVLLIAAFPLMVSLTGDGTLLAIAAFVGVGLSVGHWLGGPQPEEATVLALSTASRHPAIALAAATMNFPNEPNLGATVLLYLLVAALICVPYVKRQRRRLVPNPS